MKNNINDLAIFGGEPLFNEPLHVGRPNIGNRENLLSRINDLLNRRWLTNRGPYVREFEEKIAEYVGVKHCIAMCNGTIALEIAIRALEMKGEVIAPSFTFVATVHALQWQEIKPVFCDIDGNTHNLNPEKVESLINPNTTGIIATHIWGRPCNIDTLSTIAKKRNLKLLFDAAHAFSCSYKGKMIGQFGDAEVFSFHATKFFNTFEGGAVVTNNDSLAKKIRLMKNFGFSGMDSVIYIGTNGKMDEISAAMGLTSFESIDRFITTNFNNYLKYRECLGKIEGMKLVDYDTAEKNNYQYIVVEVDPEKFGLNRDQIIELLTSENILARRYFYPGCHCMEPYRTLYGNDSKDLRETEIVSGKVMVLPTGIAVDNDNIDKIINLFCFVHDKSEMIKEKLRNDL